MWLLTILLVLFVALIFIVIMNTSMKLALMITTLYNYETKKLFIPAALTVILWGALGVGCYNSINNTLDNDAIDILFSMMFEHSIITQYVPELIKILLSTFVIGTLLQSLTYYTVNINYQKLTGTIRFSFKEVIKKIYKKIFKKNLSGDKKSSLSEIKRGPKKLTFFRAILTSIISVILTVLVAYGLFVLGSYLSTKIINVL